MSIKQLEDGRWQADAVQANGRRARRAFNKKAEAVAFEARINRERYEQKLIRSGLQSQRFPMKQAIDDFEATKQVLRPSSIKRYRAIFQQLRLFCSACNIQYVDQFSPDHATWLFNELIREKKDPKGNTDRLMVPKPRTVNQFLQNIRSFFEYEIRKGHLLRNPMQHIRYLRIDRPDPEFYTHEELTAFFAQPMDVAYRNAFLGLLHTGMRFAELANLTWADVDLEMRFIQVQSHDTFKTKTQESKRKIPMNESLFHLLKGMVDSRFSDHLVFTSPTGKKLRQQPLLNVCKKYMALAGVCSRAFLHKFRHTFATHLVLQRKPLESIKELLGHRFIKETEIYAHNMSDHLYDEVHALDDLFVNL